MFRCHENGPNRNLRHTEHQQWRLYVGIFLFFFSFGTWLFKLSIESQLSLSTLESLGVNAGIAAIALVGLSFTRSYRHRNAESASEC